MKRKIFVLTLFVAISIFSKFAQSEEAQKKGGSISGKLMPKVSEASVMIFKQSEVISGAAVDKKRGTYTLKDVPEGTYRLNFIAKVGDETVYLEGERTNIEKDTIKEEEKQAIVALLRELALRMNNKDYNGIKSLYSKKYRDELGISWKLQDNWYRGITEFKMPFHVEGYISDIIGDGTKAAASVHYVMSYKLENKNNEISHTDRVIFLSGESGKWLIEGEKRLTTAVVHHFFDKSSSRVFLKPHLTTVAVMEGKETAGCDINLNEIYPGIKLLQ